MGDTQCEDGCPKHLSIGLPRPSHSEPLSAAGRCEEQVREGTRQAPKRLLINGGTTHPESPAQDRSPPPSLIFSDNSFNSRRSHMSVGSGSGKCVIRRGTTRLGTAVHDVLNVRGRGIPLYEWVKASRRLKAQAKFIEGLWFLSMIITFMLVVIELRRTALAGESTSALLDLFVKEEFSQVKGDGLDDIGDSPYFYKAYLDIKTQEEWWLWALGPLVKGLYNGAAALPGDTGLFNGIGLPMNTSQMYVMGGSSGGVVFRTARVESEPCKPQALGINSVCYPSWNDGAPDKDTFGGGSSLSPAFSHRTAGLESELIGTLLGNLYFYGNYYGFNGYFTDLPANNAGNASTHEISDLYRGGWLDQATRVAAVEFNVYNPETKVVTACRFFTEFAPTGGVRASYRFYHLNAVMWQQLGAAYLALCSIFVLLLVSFTFSWLRRMLTAPRLLHFLKRWDAFFDLVLLILFWVCMSRFVTITLNSPIIREDAFAETLESGTFSVGIFEDAESLHGTDAYCAINLMLATVKLVGYMPFKTTRTIWATLGGSIKDIVVLGLVVLLFWGGFSVGSHLTFGGLGFFEFERIDRTFGTLMVLMFSGSVDFEALREVSFVSAPVFYAVYMIFMWGVMLNLFVAIIVLAYERYSDVQQNFDNWSRTNHQVDHGCIVMMITGKAFYHVRCTWFRFRRFLYGNVDVRPQVTNSRVPTNKASRRRLHYKSTHIPIIEMRRVAVQSNAIVLLDQMTRVMALPKGSAERNGLAKELNYPFRRLFKEKVNQIIWLIAVRKTKDILENYTDEDEGAFINKWRVEFEYERGDTSFAAIDYFANLFRCFKKWCYKGSKASDCDELEKALGAEGRELQRGSLDGFGGSNATFSLGSNMYNKDKHRIRQITKLDKLINKDRELVQLKQEIESVLDATKTLFKRHRISYDRVLNQTWNKTNENERLKELDPTDLRELLSPGCVERNLHCKACQEVDFHGRVRTLLTNYRKLKKNRQAVNGGDKKTIRRFRLRKKNPKMDPYYFDFDGTQRVTSPLNVDGSKERPLSSAFFRGAATPMNTRAKSQRQDSVVVA